MSHTAQQMTPRTAPRLPAHIEWPTVTVALLVWTGLVTTVATHALVPWFVTVPLLAFFSGWYSSLQHEVVHGHPTPWPWANVVIAGVPVGGVYPFERFRELHIEHHLDPASLTTPGMDSESRYCSRPEWERAGSFKRLVLRVERTMAGHLTVGVVRVAAGFVLRDGSAARRDTRLRHVWLRHLVGVSAVLAAVVWSGLPVPQFLVGAVYGQLACTGLRTFAEHRAVPVGTRSAVVHAGPLTRLLYLNNNLHHTHHAAPGTPWYWLPRLHADLGADDLASAGAGLYRGGYVELARRYAFRPFCQPVHPVAWTAAPVSR
jgi:fatty acid desaturase